MTTVLLFGAGTPSGAALVEAAVGRPVLAAGRRRPRLAGAGAAEPAALQGFLAVDLNDPGSFQPPQTKLWWISFAPIWHLAPFLEGLRRDRPQCLQGLQGVVACSSSSALTKRFAANSFDRALVQRLREAEQALLDSCADLGVPCRILAPTLIYGRAGAYEDRNLSRLLGMMRRLPLLPVPYPSGLRQPIHARQLAEAALAVAGRLEREGAGCGLPPVVLLGGDESLRYDAMLERLRQAAPAGDAARRCRFLRLPPRLLLWLANPLLLLSPKAFEAMLRTQADLAGFLPVHELLGQPAQPFPMAPLALGQDR
ncbi:MAG: hypothetical protein VKJ05_01710 [Synechococcaceae cyanobacterium]|nr:hypothetical protein [Synechococcaceae cyanobacterium]